MRLSTVFAPGIVLLTLISGLPATLFPGQAHALDVMAAEMAPIDMRIAELDAGLKEIERRGNAHVADLKRWVGWWTSIKELATAAGDELKKNFEERLYRIQLAQALLADLYLANDREARGIPHFGGHSVISLATLYANTRVEAAKWAELIAAGKASWHIAVAGAVTGEFIQTKIDGLEDEIAKTQSGLKTGTYMCAIAGYGVVTAKPMRDEIASLEQRRRAIRAQMAAGDYSVQIPGLGARTRKQIEAEIAGLEAELIKRRQTFQKGELAISRPENDFKTANQLRAILEADEKSYAAAKKLVGEGLYKVWIVKLESASRIDLENRVEGLEKRIEETRTAVADGDYRAHVAAGWNANRKELEKYIRDLELQSANPQLDAKAREILASKIEAGQKSLSELQSISAFDLAIMAAEKAEVSEIITGIMKLVKPDFDHREIVRLEREEMLADIPIEAELWIKSIERQIVRLKAARAWIPSGS